MLDRVWQALVQISLLDVLDIIIVYYVIYRLIMLIRDTRAVQLIKGLVVLFTATLLSGRLRLWTLNWLLNRTIAAGFIAVPIVFWPELRRGLEQLGRTSFFGQKITLLPEEDWEAPILDLVASASILSKNKIGALIVIERETGLNEYVETGTQLDALVSKELLTNTFIPNTPLHDGAVIIRSGRVLAAGCYLPLSSNPGIARELGTRHRAAIGITEETDAIALVVSEETGIISIAVGGEIMRHFDSQSLQEKLEELLLTTKAPSFWNWRVQKDG